MDTSLEFRERRNAERTKGMIPVEMKGGTGMTRDFSSSGVFFETDQYYLAPGTPVEFVLRLEKSSPDEPRRVHCKGKVLRVELKKTGKMGVAATIDSHIFIGPGGQVLAGGEEKIEG